MTMNSACPESQKRVHFFDRDGFCVHCLLWNPDAVFEKQVRQSEKEVENDMD